MAFVMLLGSFSVLGSAYQAYKNDAIEEYNDVDAPVFTLEQYATMALDEVDRMLAKEQISLNIYIGVLDLGSITETIASVESLLTSVKTLLPLLGDAASLKITSLEGHARHQDTDLDIIYAVLNFLGDNAEVFEKFVNGSLNLGIMDSFIASFKFNIRELESALTRVLSFRTLLDEKLTVELAREKLPDIFDPRDVTITCETIKQTVCRKYNVKLSDMDSKKRKREITHPRQVAMYLTRELTDMSLPKIGASFGGRDHTTVLHACDKITGEIRTNPALAEEIRSLKEEIK
jgi:hypothetical protein